MHTTCLRSGTSPVVIRLRRRGRIEQACRSLCPRRPLEARPFQGRAVKSGELSGLHRSSASLSLPEPKEDLRWHVQGVVDGAATDHGVQSLPHGRGEGREQQDWTQMAVMRGDGGRRPRPVRGLVDGEFVVANEEANARSATWVNSIHPGGSTIIRRALGREAVGPSPLRYLHRPMPSSTRSTSPSVTSTGG